MNIKEIINNQIEGVKIINFTRFIDQRGFFTETFRSTDFISNELKIVFLKKMF